MLRTCDVHDAARRSFDDVELEDGSRSRFFERLSRIYEVSIELGALVCRHVETKIDVSLFDDDDLMMDGPRPLFILCDRKQKRAQDVSVFPSPRSST